MSSEVKKSDIGVAIAEARSGNPESLGRLLERYRNYLVLLARIQIGRRLQSKVDPTDLVQEVFLDAVRQFPQFQGTTPESFSSWLRKILAGKLAQLIRRYVSVQSRDVRLERSLEADLDSSSNWLEKSLTGGASTPSEAAMRQEKLMALGDALEKLAPDHRNVILLRQIEGVSFGEIAKRLERSEDSVQKLWVRGLEALRKSLSTEQK